MSYLFSDAQSKLSVLLSDSNTGTEDAFPLAIRKKELNRGELQFAKESKCLVNYATGTVSSGQIALPSDWIETFALVVNSQLLTRDREISIMDYERFYNYAGSPPYYYYWVFSGTKYLKFFGNANTQTYLIWYFAKPTTELSSDSDTSSLDEDDREGPVYYAAAELMQQAGKNAISDKYRAIYQKMVRDAQKRMEERIRTQIYANPDFNIVGASDNDVQGQGWV